ncbi:prolyl oligopeptidase family serine peptidase [Akkermansiaceae bacterium]|nr:prolyl oligopeptidase family serine peptidase [Akkermansiaceae bacterium]
MLISSLPQALAQVEDKKKPKTAEAKPNERKGKKRRKKATPAEEKQAITASDYGRWEGLGSQTLSANGQWLVSEIRRVDGERALHLHHLKSKKKEPIETYKQGEKPGFSRDSAWLVVGIGQTPDEIKKLKKAGSKAPKPAGRTLKLRRLKDGETTELKNVGAFSFSKDSRFAAMEIVPKPSASPASSGPGKILIIRELATGRDTTFGNVVRHAWSDQGALMAMVVDSPSISNALQVFDPVSSRLQTLETSGENYAALVWREDAMDLAVIREMKRKEKEEVSHVLLAWRGLDQEEPASFQFEHTGEKKFPKDMYLVSGLSWSRNGEAIYCGLKEREKKSKEEEEKESEPAPKEESKPKPLSDKDDKSGQSKPLRETIEENSNVEVWHSKDVDIMPLQKKKAGLLSNPKRDAIWWLKSGDFVQLENELTESASVLRSGTHAIGRDYTAHERTAMFGPRLFDLYVINTKTGKRKLVQEGLKYELSPSPNGRYVLFVRGGHVWSQDVKSGKVRNLTEKLDTHFTNQEDDTLAEQKRPYENAVWLKDSSSMLLFDRFDIWRIAPNGSSSVKLTNGAKEMIRHRLSRASFHEDDKGTINPRRKLFVALYGELTKKSGYARLELPKNSEKSAKLERLIWEDCAISRLATAERSDTYLFVKERSNDSPDLFVGRGDLRKAKQLTNTNSFQQDFLWGRSELVDFKNKNGVPLQGMLTYPANYKKGQKYPMIVYIYEDRSQDLHRYYVPTEKHPYNPAVYSAEGYFVFQPDIVYRPQEPGISAVECVVPAVEEVLKSGMVDKDRVGLVGHSWGAYQTSFIVTQTDLFAAGIAGAPLTNMMSMAVSVYWNSGQTNAWIFAESQGRMDKPFWRDVDNYVRNSPIHGLDNLKTPLLMAFGDKDGAVDWGQGVQMYNAARWAGKEDVVMLVYPGENHSLAKEENQVDYHYRVLEWFGHYLKKEDAEKWITEGKSYLDRQQELKDKKEGKPKPPAAPKKPEPKVEPKKKKEEGKRGKKRKGKAKSEENG